MYVTRTLTFTANTDAHATGDVVAAPQEIANFAARLGGAAKVVSATLFDGSDTGVACDVVFLSADGSIGAESAAFAPTDAVALTIEGILNFTTWDDAANSKVSFLDAVDRVMQCASGSKSIWVGLVARGNITPGASDLVLKLGIEQ